MLNVSDSREDRIAKISEIVSLGGRVFVLHTDRGISTNRTVFTIVGKMDSLFEQLSILLNWAKEELNIGEHQGLHPRVGSLDVIPFIPMHNVNTSSLEDKVRTWSRQMAVEHGFPIFFYGQMATISKREGLHFFRKFGLNGLRKRLDEGLSVDAGPPKLHERLGASLVTVRNYMGAFNINVKTSNLSLVKKLAAKLRSERKKGLNQLDTTCVKFMAWKIPEYGCCQVSTNIYDLNSVSLLELYQYVKNQAKGFDLVIDGSQLIGMIPLRGICPDNINLEEAFKELRLDSVVSFDSSLQVLDKVVQSLTWSE